MEIDWLKHLARLYLPIYQYESETTKIAYAGYSSIKRNTMSDYSWTRNTNHTF